MSNPFVGNIISFTKEGIEVDNAFLDKYRSHLENRRALYVIKANSHKGIFKYGVAGFGSAKKSIRHRLHSNVVSYGTHDKLNLCAGVKLYYLETSSIEKGVPKKKTPDI